MGEGLDQEFLMHASFSEGYVLPASVEARCRFYLLTFTICDQFLCSAIVGWDGKSMGEQKTISTVLIVDMFTGIGSEASGSQLIRIYFRFIM